MDDDMTATHLGNLDRRLARVEQFLPTLATKEELRATEGKLRLAIADAVAPLATKAELQAAIVPLATKAELQAAIVPLATKAELQAAIAPLATKAELQAAIAPLATKAELQAAIAPLATKAGLQSAIAPLATKEEVRAEGEQSRRHMTMLIEHQDSKIELLAEHLLSSKRQPSKE